MKAKVVSGKGEGKRYIDVYADKIDKLVGLRPGHGTFNLKVDNMPPLELIEIEGFGKFGGIGLAPCSINNERAFAVFPEKGGQDEGVIEIIAEKNLRQLFGLKDGDFVHIQF